MGKCSIRLKRCWEGASVKRKYLPIMTKFHCLRTCFSSAQTLRVRSPGLGLSVYERPDWFFPSTLDADTARAIDYSSTRSGFVAQVAPRLRTSSHATTRCLIVPGRRPYAPLISKLIPWQAYEAALRHLLQLRWLGCAYNCLPIT